MKENNIKPRNNKILHALILLIILFLVFATAFLIITIKLVDKNRREMRQDSVEKTVMITEQMDQDIQHIYEQSYRFLDNEYIKQYLPIQEENKSSYNSRLLIESISYFRNSLPEGVADVILYSDDNRLYTHEGAYNMEEYFDTLFVHDYGKHDKWLEFLNNKTGFKTFGIDFVTTKYRSDKREPIIPFIIKKNINNESWVLIVQFKVSQIFSDFKKDNNIGARHSFFILDESKNSVINEENTDFVDNVKTILLENISKKNIYIDEKFLIDGEDYYLVGNRGLENIYYFSLMSNKDIQITSIKNNFMIFALFVFSVIAYFAIIISFFNKMYNPMKVFLNFIASTETSKNQNRNQNLAVGVERIEKDYQKKNQILFESLGAELELLIRDGNKINFRNFQKRLYNSLGYNDMEIFVIYVNVIFLKKYYDDFSIIEHKKIESSIQNMFNDSVNTSNSYSSNLSRSGFVIIVDENEVEEIKKIIKSFEKIFSFDSAYCKVVAGISLKKSGDNSLYEGVYEALTVVNSTTSSSSSSSTSHFEMKEYLEENTNFNLLFSNTERNIILNYMHENNRESLSEIVNKIFNQNKENNLYFGIYINLYSIFQNIGLEFLSSLQIDLINSKTYLAEDLLCVNSVTKVKKYLLECIKYSNEFKKSNDDIEYIIEYVKDNYNEDIYLDFLAEFFEISPKNLSTKFKEKTGIHITEYIRIVRITKAKEFLIETDLSIVEIGEMVGLGNRSTFYRVFINQEGISPSKFRNINKKIGGKNEI